ncbi:MAG: DUF1405 domain-containing protein [Haloferacaceae archaeon]
MGLVPERYAEYYLGNAPSLVWLLVVNGTAFLVGVAFYATADQPYGHALAEVPTFLYPLYGDSPTALALGTLALATLLPNLGRPLDDAPVNRPLAYLHTLAFAWLVKYGLWTVVALLRRPDLYVFGPGALWAFWGITITHAFFVVEASLLPHAARTTRGALATALVLLLANDVLDYALGYHPPLRYDPGLPLAGASVALSLAAVVLAARAFEPLDGAGAGRSP